MRRRLGLGVAILLAVVAGVASASALTSSSGSDTLNGPELVQPDGSGASVPVSATDPDGGVAWAVRVYRSQAGLTCPEAGRTKDGNFGQVYSDDDFHVVDIEAAGSCADLAKAPMSLAVNHYPPNGKLPARAVIFGVVTSKVTGITLTSAAGSRAVTIKGDAFIVVTREDALLGTSLDAVLSDGSTKSYALRPSEFSATASGEPGTR
jgi:hypothetical protein